MSHVIVCTYHSLFSSCFILKFPSLVFLCCSSCDYLTCLTFVTSSWFSAWFCLQVLYANEVSFFHLTKSAFWSSFPWNPDKWEDGMVVCNFHLSASSPWVWNVPGAFTVWVGVCISMCNWLIGYSKLSIGVNVSMFVSICQPCVFDSRQGPGSLEKQCTQWTDNFIIWNNHIKLKLWLFIYTCIEYFLFGLQDSCY